MRKITAALLCLILIAWAPAPFPRLARPEPDYPTAGRYHIWLYNHSTEHCVLYADGTGWYSTRTDVWYVIWEWVQETETLRIWESYGTNGQRKVAERQKECMLYFEYPLGKRLETPVGYCGVRMKLRRRK